LLKLAVVCLFLANMPVLKDMNMNLTWIRVRNL